jgi:hypothetical protein
MPQVEKQFKLGRFILIPQLERLAPIGASLGYLAWYAEYLLEIDL